MAKLFKLENGSWIDLNDVKSIYVTKLGASTIGRRSEVFVNMSDGQTTCGSFDGHEGASEYAEKLAESVNDANNTRLGVSGELQYGTALLRSDSDSIVIPVNIPPGTEISLTIIRQSDEEGEIVEAPAPADRSKILLDAVYSIATRNGLNMADLVDYMRRTAMEAYNTFSAKKIGQ